MYWTIQLQDRTATEKNYPGCGGSENESRDEVEVRGRESWHSPISLGVNSAEQGIAD
jgi:hypothetical protein